MTVFIGGAATGGVGDGPAFRTSLTAITATAPQTGVDEVTSCSVIAAQLGLTAPAVGSYRTRHASHVDAQKGCATTTSGPADGR